MSSDRATTEGERMYQEMLQTEIFHIEKITAVIDLHLAGVSWE